MGFGFAGKFTFIIFLFFYFLWGVLFMHGDACWILSPGFCSEFCFFFIVCNPIWESDDESWFWWWLRGSGLVENLLFLCGVFSCTVILTLSSGFSSEFRFLCSWRSNFGFLQSYSYCFGMTFLLGFRSKGLFFPRHFWGFEWVLASFNRLTEGAKMVIFHLLIRSC